MFNKMLSWGRKRQFMFIFTFLLIVAIIVTSLYFVYRPKPTCFDGKKNQTELGVDCGGTCSLACSSQLVPITIWWTRIFPTTPGMYDVASLVENQNSHFGTGKITYEIGLYDKFNVLLAERSGTTFFNPQEKFVVYEPNIDVGQQTPDKAFIKFSNSAVWKRIKFTPPAISYGAIIYNNVPQPRLETTVTNQSLNILRNTKFVAVLSDANGNAIAASQTVVDALAGNENSKLNFTWPKSFTPEPSIKDIYHKLNLFDEDQVE